MSIYTGVTNFQKQSGFLANLVYDVAELAEGMIYNMHRAKAIGLDGLSAGHLLYSYAHYCRAFCLNCLSWSCVMITHLRSLV